jgi:hypothetical protein
MIDGINIPITFTGYLAGKNWQALSRQRADFSVPNPIYYFKTKTMIPARYHLWPASARPAII